MIETSPAWKSAYPGASIGVLAMRGVANPRQHPQLQTRKHELEEQLQTRFAGFDRPRLKGIPVLAAYASYYKRFKKTYHLQHQLESLVFKNRPIPEVAALVEAMFMAELKNLLLTAGHDLDQIKPPLSIDVAGGTERYVRLTGEEQTVKAGDMVIADTEGILSSILYGPDLRTRIRPETERVIFTVYAPPGIETGDVQRHLEDIRDNVQVITSEASVERLEVLGAG